MALEISNHPDAHELLTGRKLERTTMPGRFGFPFPHHLSNLVHLDIFLFLFRVILVDLGYLLAVGGLQETPVSSIEVWKQCPSCDGDCFVSVLLYRIKRD
jgi:hypothetical protein